MAEYSHLIINSNPDDFDSRKSYEEDYKDKVRLLAICYHNMSVEEAHFNNKDKSLEYSKKAYQLMKSKFGEQNHFTKKFKTNYYDKLEGRDPDNQSVISNRPASATSHKQFNSFKISGERKMPEWKIKQNPYSNAPHNRFHDHCVPHPEHSQHHANSTKPLPVRIRTSGRPISANNQAPSSLAIPRATTNKGPPPLTKSPLPGLRPSRPPSAKPQPAAQTPGHSLEYTNTIKELEALGITSSGSEGSEDEKDKSRHSQMQANIKKFGDDLALPISSQPPLPPKPLNDKDKLIKKKQREMEAKRKEEEEEKQLRDKVVKEYQERAAGSLISNFLKSKALTDKHIKNSKLQ